MAMKAMLFLVACLLLVTTRVSSIEEEIDTEHGHAKSPVKAPAHAPVKAPAHPPKKAHVHPPEKAPAHPPVKAKAPVPPVAPKHGCVPKCEEYCKAHPKRPCMKACTACCAKGNCVPAGTQKCSKWDHVMIHGEMVKCP